MMRELMVFTLCRLLTSSSAALIESMEILAVEYGKTPDQFLPRMDLYCFYLSDPVEGLGKALWYGIA